MDGVGGGGDRSFSRCTVLHVQGCAGAATRRSPMPIRRYLGRYYTVNEPGELR